MKRPSKTQLEANALRQIDTLSRSALQAANTVRQFEAAGVPCDYYRGQLTGYGISTAILATDLGIASFNTSAFSQVPARHECPSALLGRAA